MTAKRMFNAEILESDACSDMPTDAQMLYVRLNLAADDRGIVSSPRRVMRAYNFSDDCMKLLAAKKFVLIRKREEDGCTVVIIKHWRMHNTIKRDRFKESPFVSFLEGVYFDENKAYSLTPGDGKKPVLSAGNGGFYLPEPEQGAVGAELEPERNQNGTETETQYRLGKVSIGESRLEEERLDKDKENNNDSLIPDTRTREENESSSKWTPEYIAELQERARRAFHRGGQQEA